MIRILCSIALCVAIYGQTSELKPLAQPDLSAALNAKTDEIHRARTAFYAWNSGVVMIRLGSSAQIVSADRNGNVLRSVPIQTASASGAQWTASPSDGLVWIGSYNPRDKTTTLNLYDYSGKVTSSTQLPGAMETLAGWNSQFMFTRNGSAHFGHLSQGAYSHDSEIGISESQRVIPVVLGAGRVGLVNKSSGTLTIVGADNTSKTLQVQSADITRGVNYIPKEQTTVHNTGHSKMIFNVVSGASADQSGNLYYLLSHVFLGEGATVLSVGADGVVKNTYRCTLPAGFYPAHIGVAGKDLYLADGIGKVLRYAVSL